MSNRPTRRRWSLPSLLVQAIFLVSACAGSPPAVKGDQPGRKEPASQTALPPRTEPAPAGNPKIVRLPSGTDCQAQLRVVADCFFAVVTQLQAEPAKDEPLGRFLGKAAPKIPDGPGRQACASLGLSPEAGELQLSDGGVIRVDHEVASHDQYQGGQDILYIRYRFSSQACPESAETQLELHLGGGAP